LRKRREYLAVQKQGKKHHLESFLAFVLPGSGPSRFGITVSSKVGNAVRRNRVKRLLREVLRRCRDKFPMEIEVVLIAKKNAVDVTYEALVRQIDALARRLHNR
jgi:ribonuclease P protein component